MKIPTTDGKHESFTVFTKLKSRRIKSLTVSLNVLFSFQSRRVIRYRLCEIKKVNEILYSIKFFFFF